MLNSGAVKDLIIHNKMSSNTRVMFSISIRPTTCYSLTLYPLKATPSPYYLYPAILLHLGLSLDDVDDDKDNVEVNENGSKFSPHLF